MKHFKKYYKKPFSSEKLNDASGSGEVLLSTDLMKNIVKIKSIFTETPDLTIRNLVIKQTGEKGALIYLNEIVDGQILFNHVIKPLIFEDGKEAGNADLWVSLGQIKKAATWTEVEKAVLSGQCVLLVDKQREAYIYDTPSFPKRSIEDTPVESSLTGAKVGFTESASDNIALIRQHISNKELKIKEMTVGKRGKLKLSILYLADVANKEVLSELESRIGKIDVDNVINAGAFSEFIEDNPYSPFPQIMLSERPDFVASEILEGRIAIIVDRSPGVLIAPATFDTFFKTIDDYGSRWLVASFVRLMRYFGFLIAIFLPALYIAIISFHFEVIPLKLLFSIGVSRERIPFPPFIEAFLMEITLEMLREAGVRLPSKIGQTVGIVGGIVIGQAAVEAGIVSNIMVIVVALTAIASFIIPNYEMASAVRIVRFPMMILASLFGFVGLSIGFMLLLAHFISLTSLGMPYGSPFAPLRIKDWVDVIIRFPQWMFKNRPLSTGTVQLKRANSSRPEGEGK